MTRVAILGGGIAGLAAAYELETQRRAGKAIDWHLFEASDRLGGTIQTTRIPTPDGEFILEGGPDGWVTEKPWARELAEELGLAGQLIPSCDDGKKTYIWLDSALVPVPDRMRMMVPEDLGCLEGSPLFSAATARAYAQELQRAEELKRAAPQSDESVASFVQRHFGDEVLAKLAGPLLAGVFGGDVRKLSVRAVMPAFAAMEAEHGSLVAAMQVQAKARGTRPRTPTFTTLRRGMASLVEAVCERLPADRVHLKVRVDALHHSESGGWCLRPDPPVGVSGRAPGFEHVLIAVPADAARSLVGALQPAAASLIPQTASSAVLCSFCWRGEAARSVQLPPGFGFLVPQIGTDSSGISNLRENTPRLLACTFSDQKFAGRTPPGDRSVRVFFGAQSAESVLPMSDAEVARIGSEELKRVLPGLPPPQHGLTRIRRWPRSLPQYEVGHLDRMAKLDGYMKELQGLHLLGNAYRGVGVPDLIHSARRRACVAAND